MMHEIDGRSGSETPVRFSAGTEELFGVLTEPTAASRGLGVIVLVGGACSPSTSRNRFSVKLARRLAASGFHVLRFDYHGVGESSGTILKYSLRRPFTRDLIGAIEELRRHGVGQVILIGTCFGARTALSAVGRVNGIRGMAFMTIPLRDWEQGQRVASRWARDEGLQAYIRRGLRLQVLLGMLDAKRRRRYLRVVQYGMKMLWRRLRLHNGNGSGPSLDWISPAFMEGLREAVRRRIPLLFLYGSKEDHYKEFQMAQAGAVGALIAQAGDTVQVSTLEGSVQGLTTIWVQDAVMARMQEWVESLDAHGVQTKDFAMLEKV